MFAQLHSTTYEQDCINPVLSYEHNRNLLLLLVRQFPPAERHSAEVYLTRMQKAFDERDAVANLYMERHNQPPAPRFFLRVFQGGRR